MFSANNADESNKQSNAVFNTVIEFVNPVYDSLDTTAQAEYKDTATFIIRKLAHFSEYALLGILAFINFSKVKKLGYRGLFAAVFLASTLQAMRYISFSCRACRAGA